MDTSLSSLAFSLDEHVEQAWSSSKNPILTPSPSVTPSQSSESQDTSRGAIPASFIPILPPTKQDNGFKAPSQLRLAKSIHLDHIASASLSHPHQSSNQLLKAWAELLHHYVVSSTVAFAVFGRDGSDSTTSAPVLERTVSEELVASHSHGAESLPHLQFLPYSSRDHAEKINTAVIFSNSPVTALDGFDMVLQRSTSNKNQLLLHSNPSRVPDKFTSALWESFLEIWQSQSPGNKTAVSGNSRSIISQSDLQSIAAWTPRRLFEERSTLHDLVAEAGRSAPDAAAVHAWDAKLSYRELQSLSDTVARKLVALGAAKGDCVPFSFEKSSWMVVAVLGIVKAGCAMVAIDPSVPHARIASIAGQTRAKIALTSSLQHSRLAAHVPTVLTISSETVPIGIHQQGSDVDMVSLPQVLPSEPAMVIFTSGSTGEPKGAVVEHQAFASRAVGEGRALQFHHARTLQFASSQWDIFLSDVLTTLFCQGCVCIPSEEDRRFNLSRFCQEYDVSLAILTPSLARLLDPSEFKTLRTLIFAGEALSTEVVQKWSSSAPSVTLFQGCGPAEAGLYTIGPVVDGRPELLGFPTDYSVCVLVDPNDPERLVPLGAVGELLVGGPAILRDYLNDPSRTAAATVINPSWASDIGLPVTRLYKTGDLLRYSLDTLDGRFEYIGRKDNQVKFHGQRIELGDIEKHLCDMRDIHSAVVVLAKKGPLANRLVAVVQESSQKTVAISPLRSDRAELRTTRSNNVRTSVVKEFLSTKLPEFMIPSDILVVEELPYNHSMKVDRAAVADLVSKAIDLSIHDLDQQASPNGGSLEILKDDELTARVVSREFASVVTGAQAGSSRYQQLSGHDFNLQEAGIDSIQIISFHTALKARFNLSIPIGVMLSSTTTVRSLASVIDGQRGLPTSLDQPKAVNMSLYNAERTENNNIFVTGASGFLGVELLRQLLIRPECYVFALMRGCSEEKARNRLIDLATEAGWWLDTYTTRLTIWLGDLSQPRLGLSDTQWQSLQGDSSLVINNIVHNGAVVQWQLDYDTIKTANVGSTVELLRAINTRREPLRSFVYVSGGQQLSFDDRQDEKNMVKASDDTGYGRSKVVSERLVKRFADEQRGKVRQVRVVKPGYIIGDAKRGAANQRDFIWRLIAASLAEGVYDKDEADNWVVMSDISNVARLALLSVVEEGTPCEPVTKVLDGMRFRDLWNLLQDTFHYNLQPMSHDGWLATLQRAVAVAQEQHVMFPLMYMLDKSSHSSLGVPDGPQKPREGLVKAVEANVAYLIERGFFPTPSVRQSLPLNKFTNNIALSRAPLPALKDALDVDSVRQKFPALTGNLASFNNAAGTAVLKACADRAQTFMTSFPMEAGFEDPFGRAYTQRQEEKYAALAEFMNADSDEIGTFDLITPFSKLIAIDVTSIPVTPPIVI